MQENNRYQRTSLNCYLIFQLFLFSLNTSNSSKFVPEQMHFIRKPLMIFFKNHFQTIIYYSLFFKLFSFVLQAVLSLSLIGEQVYINVDVFADLRSRDQTREHLCEPVLYIRGGQGGEALSRTLQVANHCTPSQYLHNSQYQNKKFESIKPKFFFTRFLQKKSEYQYNRMTARFSVY